MWKESHRSLEKFNLPLSSPDGLEREKFRLRVKKKKAWKSRKRSREEDWKATEKQKIVLREDKLETGDVLGRRVNIPCVLCSRSVRVDLVSSHHARPTINLSKKKPFPFDDYLRQFEVKWPSKEELVIKAKKDWRFRHPHPPTVPSPAALLMAKQAENIKIAFRFENKRLFSVFLAFTGNKKRAEKEAENEKKSSHPQSKSGKLIESPSSFYNQFSEAKQTIWIHAMKRSRVGHKDSVGDWLDCASRVFLRLSLQSLEKWIYFGIPVAATTVFLRYFDVENKHHTLRWLIRECMQEVWELLEMT